MPDTHPFPVKMLANQPVSKLPEPTGNPPALYSVANHTLRRVGLSLATSSAMYLFLA